MSRVVVGSSGAA
jgi:ribosomal protein L12E/L44/L45/RPP1/RPP2